MVQRNRKQNGRKYNKKRSKNSAVTKKDPSDMRIFFFLATYLAVAVLFVRLFLEAVKINLVFAKIVLLFVYLIVGFGLPILLIEFGIYLKTGKKICLLKEL